MTDQTEIDHVARVMMAAWEDVEGTPPNVSYVATFADMARAVIADQRAMPVTPGGLRFTFYRGQEHRTAAYNDHWPSPKPTITVIAHSEAEARTKAREISGPCVKGWRWKFLLQKIEETTP